MSKVSIIIPNYNYGIFIAKTLDSVLAQTFQEYEVIVIDDGSTDHSLKVIKSFSEKFDGKLVLLTQQNKGVYAARNLGLRHAQGEYIAFLDADDIWFPELLEESVNLLEANPDFHLVYSNTEYFDSKTGLAKGLNFDERSGKIPVTGKCVDKLFTQGNFVPLMSVVMRRDVIDSVGYFDEKLRVAADYEFFMRVSSTFPVAYTGKVLVRVRRHGNNLTNKSLLQAKANLRVIRNILRFDASLSTKLSKAELDQKWYQAYYALGFNLILNGYQRRGRLMLNRAFRINKSIWHNKIVLYFFLSFMPAIKWISACRKVLQHSRRQFNWANG